MRGHPRWPGPKGAAGPTGPRAVELPPPDPPEPEPEPEPELASEPDDDAVDPALDPVVLAAPDDELELDVGEAAVLTGTRVGAERAVRRWELPGSVRISVSPSRARAVDRCEPVGDAEVSGGEIATERIRDRKVEPTIGT